MTMQLRCGFVALGVVASVRHSDAQIVNVQGQLAKAPDQDGITTQVEAKLDWREGNSPLFEIGGSGAVLVRRGKLLALALARGEYAISRDITLTRKSFEHLRARYAIDDRWRWEVFGQHEYDQFRRLSVRALAGTGPAFQILDEKQIGVLAGAAYLFEYEQLDQRAGTIDAGIRTRAHRASLYVTGTERANEQLSIVETVYLQPRVDDLGDLRLLGELSIAAKMSKHFALTTGFTLSFDRSPPDGVEQLDTQLKLGVLATF
jgi:hypothetical protein